VYKPTPISELNKIHAASAAPDDIDTKDSAQVSITPLQLCTMTMIILLY